MGHFGTKFGKDEVDRCKLNFNAIWDRHSAVVSKRNHILPIRKKVTGRQTGHGTVTSSLASEIDCQRCRWIMFAVIFILKSHFQFQLSLTMKLRSNSGR